MNFSDRLILDNFKKTFDFKGYHFFENGDYNLNIIGVRSPNRKSNSFDDTIFLIYKKNKKWQVDQFKATTDAGLYWLKNPMRIDGTAILIPNQYRAGFMLGKHKNYTALVQHEKSGFKVWRDKDKDGTIDIGGKVYENVTGLNLHRAREHGTSSQVGKWSAGCQVITNGAGDSTWNRFIRTVIKSAELYGVYFTYTLLDESDCIV